jgi:glycosyltransferase involved in cell wall biosynthesis
MLTYNRESMVGKMISCVLAQTFTDFEFIIVDNGSSDSSGKIADEYAEKDSRIKVIHREKGNIGSGRNAGLDVAVGEYIAFVDDDDEIENDYLQYLYNLILSNVADVSICSFKGKKFDELLVMNNEEAIEQLLWRKFYNNQFILKLIKRSLFDDCRFSLDAKYDDIELMTTILARAEKIVFGGEPKYIINRHENCNSRWTQDNRYLDLQTLDEYLLVYRYRTDFLIEKFPEKEKLWKYFEWSFWLSMVEKVTRLNLKDCLNKKEELLAKLKENKDMLCELPYLQKFEKDWIGIYL